MKVVFLDIDGVLNSKQYFTRIRNMAITPDQKIDPQAVDRLNQITDATGAVIVLTSSWRYAYLHNLPGLQNWMKKLGVKASVIGMTHIDGDDRAIQIQDWLDSCPDKVDAFVILDDLNMSKLKRWMVLTDYTTGGLQDSDITEAVRILGARLSLPLPIEH